MAQNPFSDPTYGASSSAGNSRPVNPFADPEYGNSSDGLVARVKQGASRTIDSARTALTDDPNKIAQIASDQARTALPQTETQRKMAEEIAPYVDAANKAQGVVDNVKTWNAAGVKRAGQLLSNPGEAGKMIAEQLPNSLPGMAGGIAGAKLGAMAGFWCRAWHRHAGGWRSGWRGRRVRPGKGRRHAGRCAERSTGPADQPAGPACRGQDGGAQAVGV